eukprot:SAG22_NODE_52_length_24288_cov_15.594568_3_plen_81_part_00
MIIGFTWGLVIGDWNLTWRGFRNTVVGCVICVMMGALFAALLSIHPDQHSITSKIYTGKGIYYGISINAEQIRTRGPPVR